MKTDSITVAKVLPKDWELYKNIRLETLRNNPKEFSSSYSDGLQFTDEYWKSLVSDENSTYLFEKNGSEITGTARLSFNDTEESNNTAVLCGLYIKKQYRKLGMAEKLLKIRLELCKRNKNIERVRTYIKTHNTPAISLYKKFGFSEIGIKDGEYIMEKDLN